MNNLNKLAAERQADIVMKLSRIAESVDDAMSSLRVNQELRLLGFGTKTWKARCEIQNAVYDIEALVNSLDRIEDEIKETQNGQTNASSRRHDTSGRVHV